MKRPRLLLLLILALLLPALFANGLLARRAAPPPWPADVVPHHRSVAVNMDLADLAQLSDEQLHQRLRQAWEDGAHLIRLRVPWALIQPQPDIWQWQTLDAVLDANEYNFLTIFVLDGSPAWARAPEDANNPYAPPQDVRDFGRFAEAVVNRQRQHHATPGWTVAYQIWDEPNIGPHWGARYADPQGYFELLREAANSIHARYPDARIMLAALAPTTTDDGFNIPDPIYLDRLLGLGADEFFDFAAGQAYGFAQPPEAPPAPDQLNFRRVELLYEVLARHGVGERPVYITSWGWWTPQAPDLDPAASPWRSIPLDALHDYQQRGWTWMQVHWPWAAAPAWVQYAPGPEDDPIRRGWVQRDAAGARTSAGEGVAILAQSPPVFGAGAYRPGRVQDRQALHFQPRDGWRWSERATDPREAGAAITMTFHGRAAAMQVQRGPYKGYLNVWIDDRPAPDLPIDPATGEAYLLLYDPGNGIDTVPLARDLPSGEHTLRIEAQGGWGHWPLRRIIVDDKPHPKPWPFWPVTAVLVIALGGVISVILSDQRKRKISRLQRGDSSVAALPQNDTRSWWRLLANALHVLAAWLPAAALVALPLYMRPVRFGPIGLPLHELLIWLGLGAAVAAWALGIGNRGKDAHAPISHLQALSSKSLDLPVLLLLVIGFFAALNASYKGFAFYDWRVTFLTPAVFYFLITRFTLRRAGGVRVLGMGALLGGVLVSVIALVQFATGHYGMAEGAPRVLALYGSANNLALVLGRLLPLAVALSFFHHRDTEERQIESKEKTSGSLFLGSPCTLCLRGAYLSALLLMAAAGFLTFSKGLLFISMPVGLLVLFIFQKNLRKPILILAVLGALALIPFLNTPRLAQITSGTGRFRLYLWLSAWRMWLDHPWLGVGPDNFLYAYRSFYALPAAWEELNLSHPHNLFFDLLTRVGLLGFLAGLWLLGGALWAGFKLLRGRIDAAHPLRPWVLGLWAGLIAGLAHGMIDNSLFLPDLMILTLLVTGVMGAITESTRAL